MTTHIGFLVFPSLTQLDLTGPVQVLSRLPGAELHLVWKTRDTVSSDALLTFTPTTTFADCPPLDVICVPGGMGADDLLGDDEVLDFLRSQARHARYVTAVCTGSLLLAAAGLLDGYRATTHWSAMTHLAELGAIPSSGRVVTDRNRITGGGVTAGLDFAFTLIAELADAKTAQMIQLALEYDPAPPFDAGNPDKAPADVRAQLERLWTRRAAHRREAVLNAVAHRQRAVSAASQFP